MTFGLTDRQMFSETVVATWKALLFRLGVVDERFTKRK